ncbi:MAG: hypothetical protein AAGU76_06470 [Sedimentibacter sp.]|uniref:hypothetical protein n=1 Tax=Sedimentibacter sp. TaxID=1960295 RepID=UPI0031581DDE
MNYSNIDILRYYINIIDSKDFLSDEELLEFLVKNYNFSTEANDDRYISDTALLINNFLLVHSEIVNDLKEITERINYIENSMTKLKSGSYEHRKLLYYCWEGFHAWERAFCKQICGFVS